MSKFKLTRKISNVQKSFRDIHEISEMNVSKTLVERISSSGDSTGTPFYHFRWKKHNLADFVVYPETNEDVQKVLKIANVHKISVTPRGSGSCYYGSGIPANGGAVMDMKRMHTYSIDKELLTCRIQVGMVFSSLMKILDDEGFELGCYPTSAYTTTIGGWIGTGGTMGIGTIQDGSLIDQILDMTIIDPQGNEIHIAEKQQMEDYFGTNGIFGVVTEVLLKIYPKSKKVIARSYGFNSLKEILDCIQKLMVETDPFELRFSDRGHEYRSTGFSKYEYYLFLIYNGKNNSIHVDLERSAAIIEEFNGNFLGDLYSERTWEDYLKHEMRIKLDNPVLMLQQVYINIKWVPAIIIRFQSLISENRLNSAFYGIINRDCNVRLVLYTPTDNSYWLHFLGSKSILHKMVKYAYTLGGRVYTYGLQNSIYLHRFDKERLKYLQKLKIQRDPNYILNPLKQVTTKISYSRINIMFNMALFWRKIAVKIGRANVILTPDYSIENKEVC
ncbi:MAG: FAD-binding oxidoreductase [Promethearchaeota archaeon]